MRASVGVFHPRVLRGLLLRVAATARSSATFQRDRVRDRGALATPQMAADDAVLAHRPGHPLVVDRVPEAA